MKFRRMPSRSALRIALLSTLLVAGSAYAVCYCHGKITVKKFYDANANGVRDTGEPLLSGWNMTVESAGKLFSATKPTVSGAAIFPSLAPASDYTVREGTPVEGNWVQSSPHDGNGAPINPVTGVTVTAGHNTTVVFGNYCTYPAPGRTPGF